MRLHGQENTRLKMTGAHAFAKTSEPNQQPASLTEYRFSRGFTATQPPAAGIFAPAIRMHFLGRFGAICGARRAFLQTVATVRPSKTCRPFAVGFSSSKQAKPLGLNDGVNIASGLSPFMQMLTAYVVLSVSAMGLIARYKSRDTKQDENVRIFNMAKRAVVKDRRVFEIVGYPKQFEQLSAPDADNGPDELQSSEGTFKITGDKGSVVVHYRQKMHEHKDKDSDIVTFDELGVDCEDGTHFSALASFLQNQDVVTHQNSESLGKKMFLPVIGGVLIGGVASFFAIRILRNQPFYVHKLVLDHVNKHEMARQLIGHPIQSDRRKFAGVLTSEAANYTIPCSGPKGSGTLIVKAFKKVDPSGKSEDEKGKVMTTPGTSWKFSTLVLSVGRNEKRKTKSAKTINLLNSGGVPSVPHPQS